MAQKNGSTNIYKENELYGLEVEKPITPAVYDTLIQLKNTNVFVAKKHKSNKSVNSFGVISSKGKSIIPFNYLQIIPSANYFIVKKWENREIVFGVISNTNKIVLNTRYKLIQSLGDYWVVTSFTNQVKLYNTDGNFIKQLAADSVSISSSPQFFHTYKNGKMGLINKSGLEIFDTNYKNIEFNNGSWKTVLFTKWEILSGTDTITVYADSLKIWDTETYIVGIKSNYHLYCNNKSVSKNYESINQVAPTLAITKNFELYGAIRKNGTEILPPQYRKIHYTKGYFHTYKNHLWSVYDTTGTKKSVFEYDSIGEINDGLFPIKRKGKWGYMNRKGKEVIHCIYDSLAEFKNGKAIISYHGAMGIINPKGDWLVKPSYKKINDFSYNFFIYQIDDLYYLKNYQDDLIYFSNYQLIFKNETIYEIRNSSKSEITSLGTKIEDMSLVSEGPESWQIFKVGSKYGFTDVDGVLMITYRYDSLLSFSEDLSAFKLRRKWGFINTDEKIIIQPQFTHVTSFQNGISIVSIKGKKGLINTNGKFILKPKYESLSMFKNDLWMVRENGLVGLFDSQGNIVIQPKYDRIEYITDKLIIVCKNGKYGIVDINGVNVLPRVYDFIEYDVTNDLLLLKKDN
jgi:WG repeat protein